MALGPSFRIGRSAQRFNVIGPLVLYTALDHQRQQDRDPAMLERAKAGEAIEFIAERVRGKLTVTEMK
ncbi:hypothetical protein SAMN06297251_108112 [Fulvimarina manganoxydans]|uniref:Uncharacterized protein n=1 Tax=Fulvimarina manganoxydans TaxID=937218 RepID=A0A1W2C2D7_9HYPH|nr:hypothetical protein [Fulvimarina manganoxydans]SMC79349.1 hypothetical protein SAMN06297251_108112 [Fulvimarina manganoxydans]